MTWYARIGNHDKSNRTGHRRPAPSAKPTSRSPPATGTSRTTRSARCTMLALETALEVLGRVTMAEVRAKGLGLEDFFIACADEMLAGLGFGIVTPREPERRGSHVTLCHPDALPLMAADRGGGDRGRPAAGPAAVRVQRAVHVLCRRVRPGGPPGERPGGPPGQAPSSDGLAYREPGLAVPAGGRHVAQRLHRAIPPRARRLSSCP